MHLSQASFSNLFTEALPENTVYTFVNPEPVPLPKLIAWSDDLAAQFSLDKPDQKDIELLAGVGALAKKTYAVRYGGHQFGRWAGQLGDGRAITLGELKSRDEKSWEFQLKGSGPTPYSRRGDGRAVLRSSLREYVASEAMHYLNVPTTRSLSLVTTGDMVERDMFYDGNPRLEPGAITSRQAPTFVRFGNFEIHAAHQESDILKKLVYWTIKNHFNYIDLNSPDAIGIWFKDVCDRTAKLMVEWLRVGFVHGVMNTDNMSILGLTIDYGPFGWLDAYEPDWTPNTTDLPGRRYCYGRQASIALWNCERLAEALQTVFPDRALLNEGLQSYVRTYESEFLKMMAGKLGLKNLKSESDIQLLADLDQALQSTPIDMTIFFRNLAHPKDLYSQISPAFYQEPTREASGLLKTWLARFEERVRLEDVHPEVRRQSMNKHNPWIVPRNYLLFNVIQAAEAGDLKPLEELMLAFKNPYDEDERFAHLALKRPDWAKAQPGSSTLSCSS